MKLCRRFAPTSLIVAFGLALPLLQMAVGPASARPEVIQTISLGPEPGNGHQPSAVAVNPSTGRVYVANTWSNNVSVVDPDSNSVVATVAVGTQPQGIAVNPASNRVYVTNTWANSVSVLDGASNLVIATVPVGENPDGVAVNPNTNRVYVANFADGTVSVIDGVTNQPAGPPVPVGVEPRGVAVDPAANRVYVANAGSDNVSVISGATGVVERVVPAGQEPRGIAVNPKTHRAYVTNAGSASITVIYGSSRSTVGVGTIPLAVSVNAATNRVYVANYADGTVSVVDGSTNQVLSTPRVRAYPTGVAANPTTNRVYVANMGSDNLSVVDGSTNTVDALVVIGCSPGGIAVNAATHRVYVANSGSDEVAVIDGRTGTVLARVPVGAEPWGIAVDPAANRIFVTNLGADTVSVISGSTNTVVATIPVGAMPWGVAVNPNTHRVYVTNYAWGNVSVIDGQAGVVVGQPIATADYPTGIAVNAALNRVYVCNQGANSVSVINGGTGAVLGAISVADGPSGVAVDAGTNRVYVARLYGDRIAVIDGVTNTTVAPGVPVGTTPRGGAASAATHRVYVANAGGESVTVVNGTSNTVAGSVRVGGAPQALAVDPAMYRVYVANQFSGTISVVADALSQPDVMIRAATEGALQGNNVYNGDGAGQSRTQRVTAGTLATYVVRLQNDGFQADTFGVTGSRSGSGWTIRYFDAVSGGTEITAQVTGTGWVGASLAPGTTRDLRVEVLAGATLMGGTSGLLRVSAVSQRSASARDTVGAATTVSGPDLLIRGGSQPDSAGAADDVYQATPTGSQIETLSVAPRAAATYRVKVQNDTTTARTFVLRAIESAGSGWTVAYLIGTTDISASVRGTTGYTTASLAPRGATTITVQVVPGDTVRGGSGKNVTLRVFLDAADTKVRDAVMARTTANVVSRPDLLIKRWSDADTAYALDNVYQTAPSGGQVVRQSAKRGAVVRYAIRVQNDGNASRSFTMKATESAGAGWSVAYRYGSSNITAQMTGASGYTTPILSAFGGSTVLVVEMTPGPGVAAGTSKSATLRAHLDGPDATVRDAAMALTTCAP